MRDSGDVEYPCEECETTTVLLGPGDDWAICEPCHARLMSMTAEEINAEIHRTGET